jgi:hypothetical protein
MAVGLRAAVGIRIAEWGKVEVQGSGFRVLSSELNPC